MDNGYINNIFLITNGLEEFAEQLKGQSKKFHYSQCPLDNLAEEVKNRQRNSKLQKQDYFVIENNLIIIKKEFYEQHLKNVNENIFLSNFNSDTPHFLFLNFSDEPDYESNNLEIDDDDFYYNVNKVEKVSGRLFINQFYLSLVFKCMANRKRVHNYIVNSFQTIVESTIIAKQKLQIEKLYGELEAISKIDTLTNVLSRKAFFEAMEMERARTIRDYRRITEFGVQEMEDEFKDISDHYGHFSCLMIDIDDFKKINDTYGHLIGDDVLKKMGELLNSSNLFRENDIIGRYGGEEFVAILPETKAEYAKIPSDRLRQAINSVEFSSNRGAFRVSISVGISEFRPTDDNCDDVIYRADKALYAAKKEGKNRVILYSEIDDDVLT